MYCLDIELQVVLNAFSGGAMFSNLVESKPKRTRRRAGTIFSFLAHYGLILGILYTSASAKTTNEEPRAQQVNFVEPPKPDVPKPDPAPELVIAPKPDKLFDASLIAPVVVPNALPDIDLTRPQTDPDAFVNGPSRSIDGSKPTRDVQADPSVTYLEFQVEQPAAHAPGSAIPAYPDILRQAGVEGEALVSFVVDTTGRVDISTFKVMRSTHDLFASAVRNALPRMRFIPAMVYDRKVRQLVQQPFSFAIVK